MAFYSADQKYGTWLQLGPKSYWPVYYLNND